MNKPVKLDSLERIEQIYRSAESKARARQDFSGEIGHHQGSSSDAPAPDRRLVAAAKREVERRALRIRYLPTELSADTGWAVLLDLFISGGQLCSIYAAQCGRRWNLSPATFARLMAALIEEGLLVRVQDQESAEAAANFRLTSYGKERVSKVLRLLDSVDGLSE